MRGVGDGESAVLGIGSDAPFAPSVLREEKVKEAGSRETIVLIVISILFRYPLYEYLPQAREEDWGCIGKGRAFPGQPLYRLLECRV